MLSGGYNLVGDTSGCDFVPAAGDVTDTAAQAGPSSSRWTRPPITRCSLRARPSTPAIPPAAPTTWGLHWQLINAGCPVSDVATWDHPSCSRWGSRPSTVAPAVVRPYETLTYTLASSNPGPAEIPGVRLTDTVPTGLTYVPGSLLASIGSSGEVGGVITWTGALPPDSTAHVTFLARAGATMGTITNTATIEGGNDLMWRTARVEVVPYRLALPLVQLSCRPVFVDNFSGSGQWLGRVG